jgi:hypothetical protein
MSIRAHFRLKPLIIGGAIVGAFVLGAVFGHEYLKPKQEETDWGEVFKKRKKRHGTLSHVY